MQLLYTGVCGFGFVLEGVLVALSVFLFSLNEMKCSSPPPSVFKGKKLPKFINSGEQFLQ